VFCSFFSSRRRPTSSTRDWSSDVCSSDLRWDWGVAFILAGSLSAVLGVLYALTKSDVKRLLAYSTIENAGIIVLGLGSGMTALRSEERRGGRGGSHWGRR